jgi:hypothetical protein
MAEKRRVNRLKEKNEVTITTVADGKTNSKEKIICSHSNDISVLGAKIQVNYFLPVNSLLKVDFNLKNWVSKISALGEVRWIKNIFKDKSSYEAGVEFVGSTPEEIEKRKKYIAARSGKIKD